MFAFEITLDDLAVVLAQRGLSFSKIEIETMFDELLEPDLQRIEKAALFGVDLDEQTEYAYSEISEILRENGIFADELKR